MPPHRTSLRILLGLALLASAAKIAIAGPPFQTDDPEPVEYRHFEAYLFSTYDGTALGSATLGPAFEFNWGVIPDVQLHVVIPMAGFIPPVGTKTFGVGDTELGVKYRFVHETKRRPEFGIFPFAEIPTGNVDAGLGNGRTWYRLPLWVQKSEGPWTTYGGAGEVLNWAPGTRNYPFGGWLLQRDLGKKFTLGGEVFSHGALGPAAASLRPSTLLDFGGYYYFKKPAFQLLFLVGHSVAGERETIAYLGLYWTWGEDSASDSSHGFLRDMARSRF